MQASERVHELNELLPLDYGSKFSTAEPLLKTVALLATTILLN